MEIGNILEYKFSLVCGTLILLYFFRSFLLKRPYKKFTAWILDLVMAPINEGLKGRKERIFSFVQQHQKRLNKSIDVLEIGSGSATNLNFLPQNTKLTCLEPNEFCDSYATENCKTHERGITTKIVHGYAEDMPFADGSFDIVVSTMVLCSVDDVKKCLSEIKRVLRPGGKFVFIEHVAYKEKYSLTYALQVVMRPVHFVVFDRCRTTRDIGADINTAGFSDVAMELNIEKPLMLWIRPIINGVASK